MFRNLMLAGIAAVATTGGDASAQVRIGPNGQVQQTPAQPAAPRPGLAQPRPPQVTGLANPLSMPQSPPKVTGLANPLSIPPNYPPQLNPGLYPQGTPNVVYPSQPGQPVYPQGQPVYPQGQPVYPQGQPVYPQGQPVYPNQPVYPQGQPVNPNQPVYPQGQQFYPNQPFYPPQPTYPQPSTPIHVTPQTPSGFNPQTGGVDTTSTQVDSSVFAPGRVQAMNNGTMRPVDRPIYDQAGNIVGRQTGTEWFNPQTGQWHGDLNNATINNMGGIDNQSHTRSVLPKNNNQPQQGPGTPNANGFRPNNVPNNGGVQPNNNQVRPNNGMPNNSFPNNGNFRPNNTVPNNGGFVPNNGGFRPNNGIPTNRPQGTTR